MLERKGDGAKAERVVGLDRLVRVVKRVAENGMTGFGKVNADLMGTTGNRFTGDQRIAVFAGDELEAGFGCLAVTFVGNNLAGLFVERQQGETTRPVFAFGLPLHGGEVDLLHTAV